MKIRTLAAAVPLAVITATALAGSADASATTFRAHDSFDPTGEVFACSPTDLTVTGGRVDEVFAGVQDANGVFHFTGTIVPHDVTLTDGTNDYTLSGASWFGDKGPDPEGEPTVATETDHFVIRDADGGVYAKVQITMHYSSAHHSFVLDTGQCEQPED